jgi:hypothetical protein
VCVYVYVCVCVCFPVRFLLSISQYAFALPLFACFPATVAIAATVDDRLPFITFVRAMCVCVCVCVCVCARVCVRVSVCDRHLVVHGP